MIVAMTENSNAPTLLGASREQAELVFLGRAGAMVLASSKTWTPGARLAPFLETRVPFEF